MSKESSVSSPSPSKLPPATRSTPTTPIAPLLSRWAVATGQAVAQWTAKTYALPDKTVASQVLMYRQLLHTPCKPGLKLSRPYQATPAQLSVAHMPWWETIATTRVRDDGTTEKIVLNMKDTGKMVISYDNLIARLWIKGTKGSSDIPDNTNQSGNADAIPIAPNVQPDNVTSDAKEEKSTDESSYQGLPLPPVPHAHWVSQLGFQQKDPVTDFRSGGVLSLAMMVWIVESCPDVYARFDRTGCDPAAVLPFGITSINVTDMMAKFLMLSKNTDRMDALLSQKPFWSMFSDPYALLTCQELALDMLADVVSELVAVRRAERVDMEPPDTTAASYVTVFDFTHILSVTETRVEHDLLGAGPLSVPDLRRIHGRLQVKYQKQLQSKLDRIGAANKGDVMETTLDASTPSGLPLEKVLAHATGVGAAATGFLANSFAKLNPAFGSPSRPMDHVNATETAAVTVQTEAVEFATPEATTPSNAHTSSTETAFVADPFGVDLDGDWIGSSKDNQAAASEPVLDLFSIDDEFDVDKVTVPL